MWLPVYLLVSTLGAAQEDEESFRQTALSVLQEQLQQGDPGLSGAVLKRIAQETTLSEVETRQRLLVLLDSLEIKRQRNTTAWQELLSVGGEVATPKTMGKFLTQLMKESRKVLGKEGDFLLAHILGRATKKAKPSVDAKILLVQVLNLGLDTPAVSVQRSPSEVDSLLAAMPAKIGLLVEAYSDYPGNRSIRREAQANPRGYPGWKFLRTSQIDTVVEKMTNIHRFIFPHLLRELPRSSYIKSSGQLRTRPR